MRYRTQMRRLLWGVCFFLCMPAVLSAQSLQPGIPAMPSQTLSEPVTSEAITARKTTLEKQLNALDESNLPKEDVDAARSSLEQMIKVLTDLQEARLRHAAYRSRLAALPERLAQLEQQREQLESRRPNHFPQVTESLREDYEAQLQAIQAEIQEINQETAAGEVRLATIPKELEQRASLRRQLEKDLLAARGKTATTGAQQPANEVELLEWKLQLLHAEVASLEAEREWLTKRGPLQDARLSVARLRFATVRRDLDTIKQALSSAIKQEQTSLSSKAETIEKKLEHVSSPTEALRLTINLETVEIHKRTAAYRQQLNSLSDRVLAQEKHNAQVRQDANRLTSLVEKYAGGEGIAQRLFIAFERLRRQRLRYNDAPVRRLEAQLQTLTQQMFALDDQLYDFANQADQRLAELRSALLDVPASQRADEVASIRRELDSKKAALREQQQVLAALLQDHTELLTLHRSYKRLLDDSYLFVLTKMFWLRDAKTFNWEVGRDAIIGSINTVQRFHKLVGTAGLYLWHQASGAYYFWPLVFWLFPVLPVMIIRANHYLQRRRTAARQAADTQNVLAGCGFAIFAIIQAALWPAYLLLLTVILRHFLQHLPQQAELAIALLRGLQMGALVLFIGWLSRTILPSDDQPQREGYLDPGLCRFMQRTIMVGCLAAAVFLIPAHVIISASATDEVAAGSLALARTLTLGFQIVILLLIGILGRRGSPLMNAVLTRSRQREGLLWRIWPIVYLLLLAGMLGLIVLDVLGFSYAAHFIGLRLVGSLSIVLALRLLLVILVLRLLQRLIGYVFSPGGRLQRLYPDVEATTEHVFSVLHTISNILLLLLAAGMVLELWGVSVTWLITSAAGLQFLKRLAVIMVTLGVTIAIIQVSSAFTDYLIQPKTSARGVLHEPSRKLKTLAPLLQTLIKVSVIFVAILILLEQISIATGPILTGVGIFGLAVGFASQSLIKDVINGLFILFEDSLSVGDVVTLRGISGFVEKVTLRAVTIRDLAGNVHTMPNSTLDMISNLTKEYSRYLMDIGIAYRENVDEVIPMLREIDAEMRADPEYGKDMLEPIEIMGLDRFEDSAVIIRARLKTRPVHQWRIGREFKRRMKKMFDERGIEIPFPHRTLYWGKPKDHAEIAVQEALTEQSTNNSQT